MNSKYLIDNVAGIIIKILAGFSVFMVFFIIGYIFYLAAPSFVNNGINFIIGTKWGNGTYQAGVFIINSIILCILTFIISVPIGLGTAIYISEFANEKIAHVLRFCIELLIGIPSVVYGLFGMYILSKLFKYNIDMFISDFLGVIPFFALSSSDSGSHILLASVVLSIMIIPILIVLTDDALKSISKEYKEGGYAIGATKWEVIKKIIVPTATPAIVSAIILSMVKAIGEATAITMAMGTKGAIVKNIFEPGTVMTSQILSSMGYSFNEPEILSALFGIAFILMTISLLFTIIARKIQDRVIYE